MDDLAKAELLRAYEGKRVTVKTKRGEVMKVKVLHVDDEYKDVIWDVIETNRLGEYKVPLESSAFVVPWSEIAEIIVE